MLKYYQMEDLWKISLLPPETSLYFPNFHNFLVFYDQEKI